MDNHPPGGGELPGRKLCDGKNNSHGCSAAGEAAAHDEEKAEFSRLQRGGKGGACNHSRMYREKS